MPLPTTTRGDYYNDGKYRLALDEFTTAIRLNPNYTYAYWYRGYAYYELGQYQRAIEDFDKAIQLDPDMALAYNNQGMPTATQDHDKAI